MDGQKISIQTLLQIARSLQNSYSRAIAELNGAIAEICTWIHLAVKCSNSYSGAIAGYLKQ